MKLNAETLLIIAAIYFFTRSSGSGSGSGSGSIWNPTTGTGGNIWGGFSPTNLPPEPKDKKSNDWIQWVQLVVYILGGMFPEMFKKGGVFGSHDPKAVTAAAFANMNYYRNPNASFPFNLGNYASFYGQNTPYFRSTGPTYTSGYGTGAIGLPIGLPGNWGGGI